MIEQKKNKTTKSKSHYEGIKTFVDPETGEKVEVQTFKRNVSQDVNFHKIWLGHIFEVLEIGNQKMKVVNYLLDEMNTENLIIKTQREIAKESKTSLSTVQRTLNSLEEANFINKKTGVIFINPDVIFKGSHKKRMYVMHIWEKEKND